MSDDTTIMSACIICILVLNTLVFFYNQSPITDIRLNGTELSTSQFETSLDDTGITETSSGLKAILSIGAFFLNIVRLLFGWYFDFGVTVNLIIKLGTYIFAIPLFITIVRVIRGV